MLDKCSYQRNKNNCSYVLLTLVRRHNLRLVQLRSGVTRAIRVMANHSGLVDSGVRVLQHRKDLQGTVSMYEY